MPLWISILETSMRKFLTIILLIFGTTAVANETAATLYQNSVLNENIEEVVIYAANKKLHVITGNESGTLLIHNLLGKQLISTQVSGNTNFDINDLGKGIYLVSFTNGRNTITKKVYIE